jgi:hypothetical protein
MNLVDCCVTKVLGKKEVTSTSGKVYVVIDVEYDSWGATSNTQLVFEKGTEPDVQVGYKFLA